MKGGFESLFKCFNDAAVATKKKRKATEESEDKNKIARLTAARGGGQVAREGMDIDYDSEATIPIMADDHDDE